MKLSKEIENNHWSISIDSETAELIENKELKDCLGKVIFNRAEQLGSSDKNIDLLFYLWFDEHAGHLTLNFINAGHEKLPF